MKPEGAFYAFVNCAELIGRTSQSGIKLNTDEDIALALLDEANIAVVQGSAFGLAPYFRIAYALDDESLKIACIAIKDFLYVYSYLKFKATKIFAYLGGSILAI